MTVKFEVVSRVCDIKLPERATENSAGYDFFAPEMITLPAHTLTRVMTGVKCELRPYMALILANRSSNPSKKGLILANGIGIVDADYYNNPTNEGEIGFEFYNITDKDVVIAQNEKIGQGVIVTYHKTEDDVATGTRNGGFGSTDNK
jgi:dUTP pyrophosphatase